MKNSVLRKTRNVLLLAAGSIWGWMSVAVATPIVLNSSESAAPGDIVNLQGDNFTTGAQVWFHVVTNTDTAATVVPDTQVTSVLSNTNQTISARLNKNIPFGLYAVWVKDSSGIFSAAPAYVNRARAMQFEYAEVPASYTFRIFGRNLCLPGATPNVTFVSGSNSYTASVVTTYPNDSNVLQITAPSNLSATGTYTVNVGNGFGHNSSLTAPFDVAPSMQTIVGRASGTDVFNLGVPWGADFANIFNATPINVVTSINPHTGVAYGADPGGSANSVDAIQQAVYDAGNSAIYPNGTVVYLPAGTFLINNTGEATTFIGTNGKSLTQPTNEQIVVPSNVVIEGAGVGTTTINDATTGVAYPNRVLTTTGGTESLVGLLNFTYTQTGTVTTAYPPPAITMTATKSFLSNVTTNFAYSTGVDCQGGDLVFGAGGNHDVLVQGLQLNHALFYAESQDSLGSNFIIRNSTFLHHGAYYRTRLVVGGLIQNTLFENNTATIDGQWPSTMTTGNVFTGTVTSGTSNTLTDSTQNWTVNALKGDYVYISSGTGLQQYEEISSNTATTLTLSYPFATTPNNSSVYSIGTGISFPYEQGGIECDGCVYGTFLNNTFNAVNLPLDYQNDYETFNSQGQGGASPDTGTVTSATSSSITDTTESWAPNSLIGQTLLITFGPGQNDSGTVTANTATTVTISSTWTTLPTNASHYSVTRSSYDWGTVASATSTTLTCSSASGLGAIFPVMGIGLAGNTVAIIGGPGTGQWRTISSNTSNTVTVSTPWTETPTSASTYSITGGEDQHILYKGNALSDLPRGVALYTGSYDCTVVDNTFYDTGETVYLRSDERDTVNGGWYGRLNLSWNDVVTDNYAFDTLGTWATTMSDAFYLGSSAAGSIILEPEFRRNIVYSEYANKFDGAIGLDEGFSDLANTGTTSFAGTTTPGQLGAIFDDNLSVDTSSSNTNAPAYLNTESYQTSFVSQLDLGTFTLTPLPYSDAKLKGAGNASTDTSYTVDPIIASVNFSGTGTLTGGTTNLVDLGGLGAFSAGSGVDSASIASTTPFLTGVSGDYLECSIGVGSGTTGHVSITPTTSRTGWGRIFDFRTGQWLVNGGFDFFWRPLQVPNSGNAMRPIDMSNGTNGIRFIFNNYGASTLQFAVIPITGSGALQLQAPYPGGFTANSIYHIGVTFSTNPTSGATTEKIFCVAGTGSFSTSSNTVGTGGLLAMGSFTLSPTTVFNTSGLLDNGPWTFGDVYGNGVANVNDYDGLNLYSQDPGTFPALGN